MLPARRRLAAAASDPLARFLAIGLLVWLAARALGPEAQDPNLLVVDEGVHAEMVDVFAETHSRAPTREEMAALLDRWVLNETLYREARALGLDRGDEMVRERIMQKMRVLIQGAVRVEPAPEAELRAWFEERRERYDAPARLSFRLARVDGTEAEARAAARRLAGGGEGQVYPFEERPRPSLVEVFGAPFVERLEALPPGAWTPIETPAGWQAVRLDRVESGERASFAERRAQVAADWEQEAFREASNEAVGALVAQYRVEAEPYDPAAFAERAAEGG
jgi:hypothetical protein